MKKLDAMIREFKAHSVASGVPIDAEMRATFAQVRRIVRDGHATEAQAIDAFRLAFGLADAEVPSELGMASMAKLALRQMGNDIPDDA